MYSEGDKDADVIFCNCYNFEIYGETILAVNDYREDEESLFT